MVGTNLQRTTPEALGIRSSAVLSFLEALERETIEMHSLLMLRHEKLMLECYWTPCAEDKFHRICSAGKALVAAAVLFAVQDGLFTLDDYAVELLPETAAAAAPGGDKVNVYNLLTMHAGHREDSYGCMMTAERPMAAFFSLPFVDEPGTRFFYDNGIPDVLAELVVRKTGKKLSVYLQEKLFGPLGIEHFRLGELNGRESLATFSLRTEDFLKVTLFFAREGNWNGEQLLDAELVRQACSWQVPTANESEAEQSPDVATHPGPGYGFQIWRNRFGGFALNGGAGQMGYVLPDWDLIVVTNANDPRSDRIGELMHRHLRGNVFARPLTEDPQTCKKLQEKAAAASLCGADEAVPAAVSGRYELVKPLCGLTALSLDVQKEALQVTLHKQEDSVCVKLTTGGLWHNCRVLPEFPENSSDGNPRKLLHGLRLDSHIGYDPNEGYMAARWVKPRVCQLHFRSDAWMGGHVLTLTFGENQKLLICHEGGIAHNLRRCPEVYKCEPWRSCAHADYTLAVRTSEG